MGWLKVAAVAVGALIVFMVAGAVVHLFFELLIAALVIGGAVAAIKYASGRRRLPRSRRDYRDYELRTPRADTKPRADAPTRADTRLFTRPATHGAGNVDDDLARLKREMGE